MDGFETSCRYADDAARCLISPINSDLVRERERKLNRHVRVWFCMADAAVDRFNWRRRRHKFRLIDTHTHGDKRLLCALLPEFTHSARNTHCLRYMSLGMRYCRFPNLIARRPPCPLSPASLPRLFFSFFVFRPMPSCKMPARRQHPRKRMREFFRRTVWPFPAAAWRTSDTFLSGSGTFRQWMRKWASFEPWQVALRSVCLVSRADCKLDVGSFEEKLALLATGKLEARSGIRSVEYNSNLLCRKFLQFHWLPDWCCELDMRYC